MDWWLEMELGVAGASEEVIEGRGMRRGIGEGVRRGDGWVWGWERYRGLAKMFGGVGL